MPPEQDTPPLLRRPPPTGSRTRSYLHGLRPELPAAVWTVVLGGTVSSVGNGFVLPYGSIYLHQVRGFAIPLAGAVVAMSALASLAAGTLGGTLVDRLSPKTMMLIGLVLQTAGFCGLGFAVNLPEAAGSMLLIGSGLGSFYPAFAALIAAVTDRAQRSVAASLQYASNNLGIGLGALIGGLLVSTSRPGSFTMIYLIDAGTFVIFGGLLLRRVPSGRHVSKHHQEGSYRVVLRDRGFLALIAFNALVILSTFAQLDNSVPLYAHLFLGIPTTALGLVLAANTTFIVLAQLPIGRAIRRLERSRALSLSCVAWGLAWLVGEVASLFRGVPAAILLGLFAIVFGFAECLLSATMGPLVADLAPAAVRGRYMAAFNLSWGIGLLLGPAIGGVVVGTVIRPGMWLLWAAVLLGLAEVARRLGHHLPAHANRGPSF